MALIKQLTPVEEARRMCRSSEVYAVIRNIRVNIRKRAARVSSIFHRYQPLRGPTRTPRSRPGRAVSVSRAVSAENRCVIFWQESAAWLD
ncbi:hypothetical protein ElyMa_001649200 [Elysia marginata]|uniref:Uncharacterized protein n=1 Tax=Elysia marginata TaxID=1093978 RepID=A0AAV4JNX4_9GAST|nr:hypothetical protein ElyMa_001649200 [Elysia marginata]